MCKTNWSKKRTDKLQELFIKTDKKSKLTKFKEKVKLTKGNGQGTCQKKNTDKKKENTSIGRFNLNTYLMNPLHLHCQTHWASTLKFA